MIEVIEEEENENENTGMPAFISNSRQTVNCNYIIAGGGLLLERSETDKILIWQRTGVKTSV